jgi:hypothetical protein
MTYWFFSEEFDNCAWVQMVIEDVSHPREFALNRVDDVGRVASAVRRLTSHMRLGR